jgi:molecular chaperone GrpE
MSDTQTAPDAEPSAGPAPEVDVIADTPDPAARLAALEAELAAAKEEHLRALAEIENVRRRGERAVADARVFAIDRFAKDLLPVADALSRALSTAPQTPDASFQPVLEGVAMTEKALMEVFARHGLRAVGAKGDKFDPNLHQAVAQAPSDAPAGTIAEVFQPGYVLADRTVRAAMVAVSLGGQATAPQEPAAAAAEPPTAGGVDIKV